LVSRSDLSGNYATLSSNPSGKGTLVVDPPVTGSFAADANGGANTSGTLTVSDGLHAQSVALLAQYMAASFVMASGGHGGTLITEPPSNQELFSPIAHRSSSWKSRGLPRPSRMTVTTYREGTLPYFERTRNSSRSFHEQRHRLGY
jgi:hypothetical protein